MLMLPAQVMFNHSFGYRQDSVSDKLITVFREGWIFAVIEIFKYYVYSCDPHSLLQLCYTCPDIFHSLFKIRENKTKKCWERFPPTVLAIFCSSQERSICACKSRNCLVKYSTHLRNKKIKSHTNVDRIIYYHQFIYLSSYFCNFTLFSFHN